MKVKFVYEKDKVNRFKMAANIIYNIGFPDLMLSRFCVQSIIISFVKLNIGFGYVNS